jgi:hypothetical protein
MKKQARVEVSAPMICRALQALGLSRKKDYPSVRGRSSKKGQAREAAKDAAS